MYGIAYFALLMLVLGLQYAYPKVELHMMANSYHTSIQDTFFKYYSMMAEWPLYALALLPLFWKKIGMTVFFALSELTGGITLGAGRKHASQQFFPVRTCLYIFRFLYLLCYYHDISLSCKNVKSRKPQ